MLGHPNFRLVPRFPAPESLGLFRVADDSGDGEGTEGSEEESEESPGEEDASNDGMEMEPAASAVPPAVNGIKRPSVTDED